MAVQVTTINAIFLPGNLDLVIPNRGDVGPFFRMNRGDRFSVFFKGFQNESLWVHSLKVQNCGINIVVAWQFAKRIGHTAEENIGW